MDTCPHCGARLEARLVAAIRNPLRDESCPSRPETKPAEIPADLFITVEEARRLLDAVFGVQKGQPA